MWVKTNAIVWKMKFRIETLLNKEKSNVIKFSKPYRYGLSAIKRVVYFGS